MKRTRSKTRAKKARRAKVGKRARSSPRKASPKIKASYLGHPHEIVYRHRDGTLRRHKFGQKCQLGFTPGGLLVVTGCSVKPFIEG
jgi:hypothetical protein